MAKTPVPPTPPPVVTPKPPGTPGAAGEPTGMFTPPPPNAPVETTKPLTEEAKAYMQEKANQNERALAPLKYAIEKAVGAAVGAQAVNPDGIPKVITAPPTAPPDAPSGLSGAEPTHVPVPVPLPEQPMLGTHPALTDPPKPTQPAASNTDSPSRGIPKPIADKGKQITGGWGHDAAGGFEPQYYALDGSELKALVLTLVRDLAAQLDQDLRFGIAITYPQVAAKVTVEITGAHAAASVNDIAFTLESRIVKLDGVRMDDPTTPADALRVEAGVPRPYKHLVQTPTGAHIVDVESPSPSPAPSMPSSL